MVRINPKIIAGAVALVLAWALLSGAFITIGAGQRGVLMTWGAVHPGVLDPGLHFKIPFVQSVARMNVQVQKSQAAETAASQDLQDVNTTVATNWHILPADAEWVYQNVGNEESLVAKIIEPAISNAVKGITAHYKAEELIVHRDKVRAQIEEQIISELKQYRVVVDSVNITDFRFSPQFAQAIEQKQVAQQHAQQAEYDLQKAQVVAQQRVVEAKAQAEAQQLLQQTITPQIIEQQAVTRWDGHLPQVLVSGGGAGGLAQAVAAGALGSMAKQAGTK